MMKKIANIIVKYRYVFLLIFVAMAVYCVLNIGNVRVENDISAYLPENTDTKIAIEIMEDEFPEFTSVTVMLSDISFDDAKALWQDIRAVPGVAHFAFENTEEYYRDSSALFNIALDGDIEDPTVLSAYEEICDILSEREAYYSATPVDTIENELAGSMGVTLALSLAIVFAVLIFASNSYAEVLAFPVVFAFAAVLNLGTNPWLGTISFVSNTVSVVLQLALAIDYSIILLHRFKEEKLLVPDTKGAMAEALAKAVPEILSSSLTTVSGLLALVFMQLTLGRDLGFVLAKGIVCSLLTVVFIMPTLLILLSRAIDKTEHKSFIPKINFLGRAIIKARYALIAIFLVLALVSGVFVSLCQDYAYSEIAMTDAKKSERGEAFDKTVKGFGNSNSLVVILPREKVVEQREIYNAVMKKDGVKSGLGFETMEILDGKYITDGISAEELSALTGASGLESSMLFSMYLSGLDDKEREALRGEDGRFYIKAVDLIEFLGERAENSSTISNMLSDEQKQMLDEVLGLLEYGKKQLVGESYARILFTLDTPAGTDETTALVESIMQEVKSISPDAILAGELVAEYDLERTFESDNIKITFITVLMILLILCITFRSVLVPILLVLIIQGAIFISFTYPIITGNNVFFFVYLMCTAVQMGATIDYAIVLSNRYICLREHSDRRTALLAALNESFPTVFTSGVIFVLCAFIIGMVIPNAYVSSMGLYLSRGTLVSIVSVLLFLPAFIYALDKPLLASVIKKKRVEPEK